MEELRAWGAHVCEKIRVRPIVESILSELLLQHRGAGRVDLDDIAEVIDARAVTYEEVELIVDRLEAEGLSVGEPLGGLDIAILRCVIVTGHRLTAELRRRPTIRELAAHSGHAESAVRRALLQVRGASQHPKAAIG